MRLLVFHDMAGALPVFIAAWMLSIIVDSAKGGVALNPSLPWIALGGIAVAILLRFVFSYGKNRLQESIGYEIAAKDRIEIGEQLKLFRSAISPRLRRETSWLPLQQSWEHWSFRA